MKTEPRICEACTQSFEARVVSTQPQRGRFCSLRCFHDSKTQYRRELRICDGCGDTMLPDRVQARALATGRQVAAYCSPECWRQSLRTTQQGDSNPHWHGGQIESRGYRYVRQDRHPVSAYVAEHRAVVEADLGRDLEATEIVHHIDGDHANNDPTNLRVVTRGEHRRIHARLTRERRGQTG